MPTSAAKTTKYAKQRKKVVPPHVSLADLRQATGLTIDAVLDRLYEITGKSTWTRGTISAIENGHRGASTELLAALAIAYGLRPGAITTQYVPRGHRERAA